MKKIIFIFLILAITTVLLPAQDIEFLYGIKMGMSQEQCGEILRKAGIDLIKSDEKTINISEINIYDELSRCSLKFKNNKLDSLLINTRAIDKTELQQRFLKFISNVEKTYGRFEPFEILKKDKSYRKIYRNCFSLSIYLPEKKENPELFDDRFYFSISNAEKIEADLWQSLKEKYK